MDLKNSVLNRLFQDEVSTKKTAMNRFTEKLWKFAKDKISTHYGYNCQIDDEYMISIVNNFIKTYDPKFESRNMSENNLLCNTAIFLTLDTNTFMYVIAGNPFSVDDNTKLLLEYSSERSKSYGTRLKIYIYGRYAKKYLRLLKSKIQKKSTGNLRIFNISANSSVNDKDSFQSVISDLIARDVDTLFYENNIKENVIAHIDGFFKTKDLYKEKNINYKTSLLLYGPPGTGKSSLANALCNKYGIDMVLIDLNTFDKLDINMLTKCINGDDKTYLVLIEDIDTVFNVNRQQETLEKDDKKVVNKMLQFLDSNSSPNNVIFICTTNHIDKLDEAILRKGRIDKNIYVGPISKETAVTMCKSFDISDESIERILAKFPDSITLENGSESNYTVNQSSLQAEILDQIKADLAAKAGTINKVGTFVADDEESSIIPTTTVESSNDDNDEIEEDVDFDDSEDVDDDDPEDYDEEFDNEDSEEEEGEE